jgi:hypothetical protein
LVGQIYTTEISERIVRLWDDRTVLLDAIERLPQTLCHNDAFRRNLFMRYAPDGELETVAIDWATVGTGAVGQELGMLVAGTLEFQEVDVAQAAQLDTIAFEGYLDGLRSAGWHDDLGKVRFAYAAAAPFISELGYAAPFVTFLTEQDNNVEWIEQTFGAPIDELKQLWVQTIGFRLRLADEARVLIDSIG